jgi:hypothetical protein
MPGASFDGPDDQLLLHALVIKGFCSDEAAAEATGLPLDAVTRTLARLSDAGLVRYRDGRISGWSPLAPARDQHRLLLDGPLAAADRDAALAVYERFSAINTDFKQVCGDWQVRTAADGTSTPNDHSDAGYDAAVVARLGAIHADASALCAELEPGLPRVARYHARLAAALAAVEAGDHDRFTRPLGGSYHDVWMELHHDLILTLGVTRTAADA